MCDPGSTGTWAPENPESPIDVKSPAGIGVPSISTDPTADFGAITLMKFGLKPSAGVETV